jgi:hypothetical protein
MLMASETAQKDSDSKPEVVINVSSDSSSSSSSDSDDDIPIVLLFRKLVKSHPTSTKTNKKPSRSSTYELVGHIINEKLEEMAERRDKVIDTILRHNPQPLNIQPLNMIIPENVEPTSEKASETTPEAAASDKVVSESPQQQTPEPHKPSSPQQPPTITETDPQLNQQPEQTLPKPTLMDIDTHQVNLQASTSTSQINPDQPSSSTQSEQITIPESNPVQDLSLSDSDQPSDLETLEQPPLDILESDYIDDDLLKILSEIHHLVDQRRTIDLTNAYEEEWASVQKRATEMIEDVRNICIRIKEATVRRFMKDLKQSLRARGPRLLLANKPFFSEADYLTREARMFKLLRQKMAQQQQEAKARELELLQRQQSLEALVKKQAEQLEKMMKQQQTNP